jgi:formate-dependent nitrite reductase membrane component NrfD
MDPIILLQEKWSESPHVALYLFFGGLTAGTFLVAVALDLFGFRSRRAVAAAKVAAYAAIPALALGGFFLTSHLGKPERGLAFPLFFTNYDSWMTRGGWILGASAPLILLYAGLWYFGAPALLRRLVGFVGAAPAAGLGLYTGMLLSGAGFVPLWSRDYLPLLFLNSGLNTGLAAAGLAALLCWRWLGVSELNPRPVLRWIGAALLVFVVLEGWELYRFMRDLASQGLLIGQPGAAGPDRFGYQASAGGALESPATYTVLVTWVNNSTGAEEGMSAETPVALAAGQSQIVLAAPRRLGLTYNVYLGRSARDARQVVGNLGPGERVALGELAPAGLPVPENLETGGRFLESAGGPIAYRYVTGGPDYPGRLLGSRAAEATPEVPLLQGARGGGTLAPWFWWGVVGLALAVPVVLTVVEAAAELGGPRLANAVAGLKFLAVLGGGLVLRFVMVWGGDLKAPLAFPPSKFPVPGLTVPMPPIPGVGG